MTDRGKGILCRDNIVKWDMAETKKGGPFKELLDGECDDGPFRDYII